jgi:hypothetical protein
MKVQINRYFTLVVAVWLMAIQAGIPVYKMICTEDGHTSVSFTQSLAQCEDEHPQEKDCCKPIQKSEKSPCCDFNQSILKLDGCPTVYEPQLTTGHWIPSVEWFFAPLETTLSTNDHIQAYSFPDRKQSRQSMIQVFRI